jgi:hypothetical protein
VKLFFSLKQVVAFGIRTFSQNQNSDGELKKQKNKVLGGWYNDKNMNNVFKCPQCGEEIEISEALKHQISEEVIAAASKKHALELAELKIKTEKETRQRLEEEGGTELLELKKIIKEKEEKIDDFRKNELELREKSRKLEEKEKNLELETKRRLDEERKNIEEQTAKRVMDDFQGQVSEKDKQISDMARQIDDLRRISKQNSMQTQGEVGELALEKMLRELFITDVISEVKKGELGGDVRQTVRTPLGTICGLILWERKRTKVWDEKWISKLKEDMIRDKANLSVIVTDVLPKDFKKLAGERSGVWITTTNFIEPLAMLLRKVLYDVAKEKALSINKQSKAEEVYDFIRGHEFIAQVDRMTETYQEMKLQISRERVAAERQWKLREVQVDRLLRGMAGTFGSLQGFAGKELPTAKSLDMESPSEMGISDIIN